MILELIIILLVINIIAFVRIMIDKSSAQKSKYNSPEYLKKRMSEVSIVAFASFGGAFGTLLAMKISRHKTTFEKQYLRRNLYLVLIQNIIMWTTILILAS